MLPELYHAHRLLHLEDLPFWVELARRSEGMILELGCGSGGVLLPLADGGHRVMGIDHNLAMLQFTDKLAEDKNLAPWLVAADIRRFRLLVNFSLILLPCNTYSMLDKPGRIACLECVRRHLAAGGRFAFSIPNPNVLKGLAAHSETELEDEFTLPLSGIPVQVSSTWQRTRRLYTVTWIYDQLLPDGRVERITESVALHLIPVEEYLVEIQSAGLNITDIFGDFDHADYRPDSPYFICVCTPDDC